MSEATLAIALIVGSAFLHAVVNALHKQADDKLVFRGMIGGTATLTLWPLLFFVPVPTGATVQWLALSVLVHLVYQALLASSYRLADLSAAHPLARGLGSLLTGAGAVLFLAEPLSDLQWLGLVIATTGMLTFALEGRAGLSNPAGLAYAAATGLMISGYTLIDAVGVRSSADPLTFIVWFLVLDGVAVTAVFGSWRRGRYLTLITAEWKLGLLAGLLSIVTYGAVLYAFRIGPTAPLAALRETGILFTALLGTLFLKESFGTRRIAAAIVLVSGLMLLQMMG